MNTGCNRKLAGMLLACIFMSIFISPLQAQKASEVLENGLKVESGHKIFLRKEGPVLKFDVSSSPRDFTTLGDSGIFMAAKNGVNIYMRPLNPLNYGLKTANMVVIDPVTEDLGAAVKAIVNLLNTTAPKAIPKITGSNTLLPQSDACGSYDNMKLLVNELGASLSNDRKEEINRVFKALKALPFEDESLTIADLRDIKSSLALVEAHFTSVEDSIKLMKDRIRTFFCPTLDTFVLKFVFTSIQKELESLKNEQKKRLKTIRELYVLAEGVQKKASTEKDGLKWWLALDEVPATEGKVSVYTTTISESGYALSDKGEIEPLAVKEVIKKTIRVRKFQRFVPEVSAGVAYTFLEYPQYGTAKNAAGETIVAETGKKSVSNLNFTAMINFNYFIRNSYIHPFWQIGVGANNEIPTLLTGVGIRSNIGGIKRIALAGGVALSWIRTLDQLQPGVSKVAGTAEIEKDLKYTFNRKQRSPFYLGIQYNL